MCFFKEKQLIVFISTVNFRNISTYGTPKKYKVINHLVNLLKGKIQYIQDSNILYKKPDSNKLH